MGATVGVHSAFEKRWLHTSQPSLSRQIRDLEYQVRAALLVRSVHGVELTAAGKAFLDHARLALSQVDAAVEAARRAVVSRPLAGEPPTIDVAVGYSKANSSPTLKLFLSLARGAESKHRYARALSAESARS
jgi:hypothetical protein